MFVNQICDVYQGSDSLVKDLTKLSRILDVKINKINNYIVPSSIKGGQHRLFNEYCPVRFFRFYNGNTVSHI